MSDLIGEDDYQHNIERAMAYKAQLHSPEGAAHMQYLVEGRGLALETIERFHLGAVLQPHPTDMQAAGRICIPRSDERGPSVLRFRAMPGQPDPKYWAPAGSRIGVFNVTDVLKAHDYLVIAEGEFDAIILSQCGFKAVGYSGVMQWKDYQRHLYEGFQRVYVVGDGDEAGEKFAATVAANVPSPRVVGLPHGQDINSLYLSGGREVITNLLGFDPVSS